MPGCGLGGRVPLMTVRNCPSQPLKLVCSAIFFSALWSWKNLWSNGNLLAGLGSMPTVVSVTLKNIRMYKFTLKPKYHHTFVRIPLVPAEAESVWKALAANYVFDCAVTTVCNYHLLGRTDWHWKPHHRAHGGGHQQSQGII